MPGFIEVIFAAIADSCGLREIIFTGVFGNKIK
jgi:hypothetical protein